MMGRGLTWGDGCGDDVSGFGTVYKSTNKLDGHEYAIKKIRLSSAIHWRPQLEKVPPHHR
jgi:hypothetical protein